MQKAGDDVVVTSKPQISQIHNIPIKKSLNQERIYIDALLLRNDAAIVHLLLPRRIRPSLPRRILVPDHSTNTITTRRQRDGGNTDDEFALLRFYYYSRW